MPASATHTAPPSAARHAAPPLHVAQVIGSFTGGGAQRLAWNLAAALAGQPGCRSVALAVRTAGSYAADPPPGLTVRAANIPARARLALAAGVLRLQRIIRAERLDVLHLHGASSLPLVVAAVRSMRPRPRVAFTWHNAEDVVCETGWRRRALIWALRRCDALYGSCASVAVRLNAITGRRDAVAFRNGVPERPLEHAPPADRPPLLVWMSRFVATKNPAALIGAARRLREAGIPLRVCMAGSAHGAGSLLQETRARIAAAGLRDVIATPGFIDDVPALLRTAAVGVQSSHAEGLSMSLLEQMMAGLAIVATDVGDTAVAVEHGRDGLLVPPGDDEALFRALRAVLIDPDLRTRLGAAARRRAVAEFSESAMAARALRDYRALARTP